MNRSPISVLYTNARSLIPKRNESVPYIAVEQPEIVAITETLTIPQHLIAQFSIPDYEAFYKNGTDKKREWRNILCQKMNQKGRHMTVLVEVTTINNKKY